MSLTPSYIPTHGTVAERVVAWFRANPEEELDRKDVSTKFDVRLSRVVPELHEAVMRGDLLWINSQPDSHYGLYRLGDGTPRIPPKATTPPAPAIAAGDLVFSISPDRCIAVSFTAPGSIDPRMVLAAMLTAAATTIGKQP